MCFQHAGLPHTLVLEQCTSKTGILLLTFGLVFGKVAAYRNGEHRTYMDFRWPIGQPVYDTRARIGHHTFSLHYLASPAYASQYSANDSHVLAVLPTRNVWVRYCPPLRRCPYGCNPHDAITATGESPSAV
jgi:hypothetical protein